MSSENSVKKNSIYNVVKTCFQLLFPLVTYPYVLRILLPDNIGKVNFASSVITYFSLLASLGVSTYAIRECAKYKNDKEKLSKTVSDIYTINIITTLISCILLIICILALPKFEKYRLLLFIQGGSIVLTTIGTDWVFGAVEDFRYLTIRTICGQLAGLILIFLCIRTPDDYIKYALINVLSVNGVQLINVLYRTKYCKVKIRFNREAFIHFSPILMLFSMMFAQQILASSDSVMLGFFKTDYDVGIYGAANKIYSLVNTTIASITWVLLPSLSNASSNGNKMEMQSLLRYGTCIMTTIGIPVVSGIFFLAPELVLVIAGKDYVDSIPLLQIFSVVLLFSFVGNVVFNMCLLALGKDKVCATNCIINASLNIALNLWLIPYFGAMAAAITTLISMVFSLAIAIPFVEKGSIVIRKSEIICAIIEALLIGFIVHLGRLISGNSIVIVFMAVAISMICYLPMLVFSHNDLWEDIYSRIRR